MLRLGIVLSFFSIDCSFFRFCAVCINLQCVAPVRRLLHALPLLPAACCLLLLLRLLLLLLLVCGVVVVIRFIREEKGGLSGVVWWWWWSKTSSSSVKLIQSPHYTPISKIQPTPLAAYIAHSGLAVPHPHWVRSRELELVTTPTASLL
jgi:hypothetical protein